MTFRLRKQAQIQMMTMINAKPPKAATLTPTAWALVRVVGLREDVAAAAATEVDVVLLDKVDAGAIGTAVSVIDGVALGEAIVVIVVCSVVCELVFDRDNDVGELVA